MVFIYLFFIFHSCVLSPSTPQAAAICMVTYILKANVEGEQIWSPEGQMSEMGLLGPSESGQTGLRMPSLRNGTCFLLTGAAWPLTCSRCFVLHVSGLSELSSHVFDPLSFSFLMSWYKAPVGITVSNLSLGLKLILWSSCILARTLSFITLLKCFKNQYCKHSEKCSR